jgi:hypothetical protein
MFGCLREREGELRVTRISHQFFSTGLCLRRGLRVLIQALKGGLLSDVVSHCIGPVDAVTSSNNQCLLDRLLIEAKCIYMNN